MSLISARLGSIVTTERRMSGGRAGQIHEVDAAAMMEPVGSGQSDVGALIEPYRRELHLHCYRLLGSLLDAEDAVQETMVRAWRHFDTFKGQSSMRTWLYRIATNACFDMLKKHEPRTLPTVAFPGKDIYSPVAPALTEVDWLEPFPDSWLEAMENPEARYGRYESVSLAFLTALQLLPARQRAILLLADVLDWRAGEIAQLLEISVSAVNSALHRARVTLEKHYPADRVELLRVRGSDAETDRLLARYVQAWETDDVDGLVALLKEDAIMSMPPIPSWYRGHTAIHALMRERLTKRWRLLPTSANGQMGFAVYKFDEVERAYRAFAIQVVALDHSQSRGEIAEITSFHNASLVEAFGFPLQLPG